MNCNEEQGYDKSSVHDGRQLGVEGRLGKQVGDNLQVDGDKVDVVEHSALVHDGSLEQHDALVHEGHGRLAQVKGDGRAQELGDDRACEGHGGVEQHRQGSRKGGGVKL